MPIFSNVPGDEAPDEVPSVTLHSTWVGIWMTLAGAVLFLGLAWALLAANGPNPVTVGLGVISLVFAAVAAFDLPFATDFRTDGVVRRTALRHQFIAWDRVTRLRRIRGSAIQLRRDARGGGFAVDVGRRNYMLVDTMESRAEFDDLRRLLGVRCEALGLVDDLRPPDSRNPTWLYRRARWRPESAGGR